MCVSEIRVKRIRVNQTSNLIFTACVACKNLIRNRQKINFKNQFRELEISKVKYRQIGGMYYLWDNFDISVNNRKNVANLGLLEDSYTNMYMFQNL